MSLVKTFRGSKSRIIQIKRIVENLTKDLATVIRVQGFLKSLIGLYAITDCDTVSAFAGKGKAKALKCLMKNRTYVDAFMDLGLSWNISDETGKAIERFVCELYKKKMQEVNLLRYQLHCAKAGKVEPEGLPPCKSFLQLHITRANYQAGIWRRDIFPLPEVPLPRGHGWEIAEGEITVKWLNSKPPPEEILEFLSCSCKKSCLNEDCCCFKAGPKCTDM